MAATLQQRYNSMCDAVDRLEGENKQLRSIIAGQVKTNDILGNNIDIQDQTNHAANEAHNETMRGMAAEIKKLRSKVRGLGGSLED